MACTSVKSQLPRQAIASSDMRRGLREIPLQVVVVMQAWQMLIQKHLLQQSPPQAGGWLKPEMIAALLAVRLLIVAAD